MVLLRYAYHLHCYYRYLAVSHTGSIAQREVSGFCTRRRRERLAPDGLDFYAGGRFCGVGKGNGRRGGYRQPDAYFFAG